MSDHDGAEVPNPHSSQHRGHNCRTCVERSSRAAAAVDENGVGRGWPEQQRVALPHIQGNQDGIFWGSDGPCRESQKDSRDGER